VWCAALRQALKRYAQCFRFVATDIAMSQAFYILAFLMSVAIVSTAAQSIKIKKQTEIAYNYFPDGETSIDTVVREYDIEGNEANSFVTQKTNHVEKLQTIDSTANLIHWKQFWSDATIRDVFQFNYKDSSIIISIQNSDTTQKWIRRMKGKRLLQVIYYAKSPYSPVCEITNYDKQILFRTKTTLITSYDGGWSDTAKYCYNKLTKTLKEYNYNTERNEWYKKKKEKFNAAGRVKKSVDTFYHNDHKMYFTSCTKYKYNNMGKLAQEITYDRYLKMTEKKIIYQYDYY
jgi:hypothetical protein